MKIKDMLTTTSGAPVFDKLFQMQAQKIQKKLVQVNSGNFSHEITVLKEIDFTLGSKEDNLLAVQAPFGAIGQVIEISPINSGCCRVLVGQDMYHISAAYLKLINLNS